MLYQRIYLSLLIFLTSLLIYRFVDTSSPPRPAFIPISLAAQVSGLPEIDGIEKTYPLIITHLFNQDAYTKNLQYQTNLRLRSKQDYQYGDILRINGFLTQYNSITNAQVSTITNQANSFFTLTFALRTHIELTVQRFLPPDHANLALGMTVGSNTAFSSEIEEAFRRTSTMHMIVVSGFNITIITALILHTAGYLHRRWSIVLSIIITVWFVLITGAQPPAIRAAVMATVTLIAQFYGRLATSLYTLILSALIMLLFSPQLLVNLSFQLSFAATTGVILLTPFCQKLIQSLPLSIIHNEIATTLAAQIAVTPLILQTFGSFSLIAPISNLTVSWTIPFIMSGTVLLTLLGTFADFLGIISSYTLIPFTAFFLQSIQLFQHIPYTYFSNFKIPWYICTVLYILIAFILSKSGRNKNCSEHKENSKTRSL